MISNGRRYLVNSPAPIDWVKPISETFSVGVLGDACTKKMMKIASANKMAANPIAIGISARRRIGRSSSSTLSSMITNTTSTIIAPAYTMTCTAAMNGAANVTYKHASAIKTPTSEMAL